MHLFTLLAAATTEVEATHPATATVSSSSSDADPTSCAGHPKPALCRYRLRAQRWRRECPGFRQHADTLARAEPDAAAGVEALRSAGRAVPPAVQHRAQLAEVLQRERSCRGAELGVLDGAFALQMLQGWNATEYLLVDLWAPLTNYVDVANGNQEIQDGRMHATLKKLRPYRGATRVCRNFTTLCAQQQPDEHFDFVYVDARHDYLGVSDDLAAWWPKLRPGGIFAGHDCAPTAHRTRAFHLPRPAR